MSIDSRPADGMKKLAIWGTQTKTEIGGMTVIGEEDGHSAPYAYVGTDPDGLVRAYNAYPKMVEFIRYVENYASAMDGDKGRMIGASFGILKNHAQEVLRSLE